jgi:hypothetical protein
VQDPIQVASCWNGCDIIGMSGIKESWKDVEGFNGDYQVSNLGRIRSFKWGRERLLKQHYRKKDGYLQIQFTRNGRGTGELYKVHRLVAEAFIPNPEGKPFVCHADDNPSNNLVANLWWGTVQDNNADKVRKGRHIR